MAEGISFSSGFIVRIQHKCQESSNAFSQFFHSITFHSLLVYSVSEVTHASMTFQPSPSSSIHYISVVLPQCEQICHLHPSLLSSCLNLMPAFLWCSDGREEGKLGRPIDWEDAPEIGYCVKKPPRSCQWKEFHAWQLSAGRKLKTKTRHKMSQWLKPRIWQIRKAGLFDAFD